MSYLMESEPHRSGRRNAAWIVGAVLLAALAVIAFIAGRAQSGPGESVPPGSTSPPIRWDRVGPWDAPTSADHGPARAAAGLASGFSHDDLGAALAAVNIGMRLSVEVGPQVYIPTARTQTFGDVDTLLAQVRSQPYGTPSPVLEMAYKVLSGDPGSDLVLVSIATRTAASQVQGGWNATAVTLRWQDGDWHAQVPLAPAQLLRSTEGYRSLGGPDV